MSNNRQSDGVSRRRLLQTSAVTLGTLGITTPVAAAGDGVITQTVDVYEQGELELGKPPKTTETVRAEDGATVRRTRNAISIELSMPVPAPGSYTYPEDTAVSSSEEGPPEVFTLWFFQLDPLGAFGVAGEVVDGEHGKHLTLSGNVSVEDDLILDDLVDPMEGKLNLAVAPHGALDPELLPEALQDPVGSPSIWWMAFFDDPD